MKKHLSSFLLVAVFMQVAVYSYCQNILIAEDHPKFVNDLPKMERIDATNGGIYEISMQESDQWLGMVDTNGDSILTKVWGYTYNNLPTFMGPTIIAKKDVPIEVKWKNDLPSNHFLPIDPTIHQARPNEGVPTVVHLHGGHVEEESDGYPEAWYTNNYDEKGAFWSKDTYYYANDQEAAPLWYHDHALGFTRLNVYAGLTGMYLIRDDNELAMNLPSGDYERELIIQDRQFAEDGSMYYPALLSDPEAGFLLPDGFNMEPTVFVAFSGDYILVNGMTWPKLEVEPTKYRFRLLNASDTRFYDFKLSNGSTFQLIGTDGGLLNHPVDLVHLLLSPGERADIVIDFSTMVGNVTLENIGPDGSYVSDEVDQDPANPNTTGKVMQFNVQGAANEAFNVPYELRPPIQVLGEETKTRKLTLIDGFDQYGRFKPSLGTVEDGKLGWVDEVTETPIVDEVEVWEIYNVSNFAHPVHIHQISFQLLNTQKFVAERDSITSQLSNIEFVSNPELPGAHEQGLKDTYIVQPGEVARFKVKFDIPGNFAWHCHILSHEDWDMMRPLRVLAPSSIEDVAQDNNITLYPNPNRGNLTIELTESIINPIDVSILNLQGQMVGQQLFGVVDQQFELNTSNIENGMYFIRIESKDFVHTKKIMILN